MTTATAQASPSRSGSRTCCWIDTDIKVLRVDEDKLIGDRVVESSEAIRKRARAARNIQTKRYSSIQSSNDELSHIVRNTDMLVG